jgi:hypothetical protein
MKTNGMGILKDLSTSGRQQTYEIKSTGRIRVGTPCPAMDPIASDAERQAFVAG